MISTIERLGSVRSVALEWVKFKTITLRTLVCVDRSPLQQRRIQSYTSHPSHIKRAHSLERWLFGRLLNLRENPLPNLGNLTLVCVDRWPLPRKEVVDSLQLQRPWIRRPGSWRQSCWGWHDPIASFLYQGNKTPKKYIKFKSKKS